MQSISEGARSRSWPALPRYLAWRQLRARWRQTWLSIASVGIGVAILTTALSLTNGFEKELVDKILGTSPHVEVGSGLLDRVQNWRGLKAELEQDSRVQTVLPVIKGQALLTDGQSALGLLVYGVNPLEEEQAGHWKQYLKKGTLDPVKKGGIVLGSELAQKISVGVGSQVQLITGPESHATLQVTGIFQSGLYELDVRVGYVNLADAQQLYGLDQSVHTLSVKLHDVWQARAIAEEWRDRHPANQIRTWLDQNQSLLRAMSLEKKVIFLVILFIIIVAMLGIANTLVMVVLEKSREIAILQAIGLGNREISRIFMWQGIMIGLSGIALGCAGGWGISTLLGHYPLRLPNDVYYIDKIPVDMQPYDFLAVCAATFAICLLASIFPARRAVRLHPIETLRRGL